MTFRFDLLENADNVFGYSANYSTLVAVNLFLYISKHCHHCTVSHRGSFDPSWFNVYRGSFVQWQLLKF
jgi:hypothetical protein